MRCLVEVIDQIVAVEPSLEDRLKPVRDSSLFAAPECQQRLWRMAAEILSECAPEREDIRVIFVGSNEGTAASGCCSN